MSEKTTTVSDPHRTAELLARADELRAMRCTSCYGEVHKALVTGVHDGDTLTAVYFGADGAPVKRNVRISGLDAPELHPNLRTTPMRELHVRAGAAARDALAAEVNGRLVWLVCAGEDKYGRMLADVYDGGDVADPSVTEWVLAACRNLGEWMVASDKALRYGGGHKAEFTRAFLEGVVAHTEGRGGEAVRVGTLSGSEDGGEEDDAGLSSTRPGALAGVGASGSKTCGSKTTTCRSAR